MRPQEHALTEQSRSTHSHTVKHEEELRWVAGRMQPINGRREARGGELEPLRVVAPRGRRREGVEGVGVGWQGVGGGGALECRRTSPRASHSRLAPG